MQNAIFPNHFITQVLIFGIALFCATENAWAISETGTCPDHVMTGTHMGMSHMNQDMSAMSENDPWVKLADDECANCHGVHGLSHSKDVPHLAGQNALYLCEWLTGCHKEGKSCESHEDVAEKLTEKDILGLSRFYASMHSFSQ